jgi:hypothetical protein
VRWLVEKVGRNLTVDDFEGHGLFVLLRGCYGGSPPAALREAGLRAKGGRRKAKSR